MARTGQPEQGLPDRIARKGLPEKDKQNVTGRIGKVLTRTANFLLQNHVFCLFVRLASVKKYHTVEASTTRGTTALVYCLINCSLYTGTVHRWWSTPN
jgi:hypothetical protein